MQSPSHSNVDIEILGCGEAFDGRYGNCSFLIRSDRPILIDCGYQVPASYFSRGYSHDFLDAIYLSHFHADHALGVGALLAEIILRSERTKPLHIFGNGGVEKYIETLIEFSYEGVRQKAQFPILYEDVESELEFGGFNCTFAKTVHPATNLAIRLEASGRSVAFSGDGELTPESRELFTDTNILFHDAYQLEGFFSGHETVQNLLELGRSLPELKQLVLVHMLERERAAYPEWSKQNCTDLPFEVILASPGQRIPLKT